MRLTMPDQDLQHRIPAAAQADFHPAVEYGGRMSRTAARLLSIGIAIVLVTAFTAAPLQVVNQANASYPTEGIGSTRSQAAPTEFPICNLDGITINSFGVASPYPSNITVSGFGTS